MTALAYRPAEERDRQFIVESWRESYRCAHAAGMIAMEDWRDIMTAQIRRVLARPGVETFVAYRPGAETGADLYGWISVENDYVVPTPTRVDGRWVEQLVPARCPLVHYMFVKLSYRRMGLARGLLKAAGVDPECEFLYSCKTGVLTKLAGKMPLARWSPLICRYSK